ncbi:2-C-methyl-D-erythritol 4-phosphate cytidylyltransferase [Lysinibacter cavernae]|uniref:Bifunctional enzyme IspD/IspF n=1 Tax=Lysinibacter cavernae TaxID=1640652 RepID=A0A7X5R460_9MICO|nr:2-C-methyl-D-erythritol 4-phosphate cytidylyltransferase/2-C-methyl-D-erythritol 2,4-cyclodiphosphate synthase [Lysinibacter cavernae]
MTSDQGSTYVGRTSESVAVIVVAAGSGTRLDAGLPKALVPVAGRTVLDWCIEGLAKSGVASQIIIVAPECDVAALVRDAEATLRREGSTASVGAVAGGLNRFESVQRGLDAVADEHTIVLVHDAARPSTPVGVIRRVVAGVEAGAAGVIPVLPVADTLNRVDEQGRVVDVVDRSDLASVQTPQGFRRSVLDEAYRQATTVTDLAAASTEHPFTDDASVVRAAGRSVHTVAGDQRSLKITTAPDLERVAAWLVPPARKESAMRVGTGTDVHAFAEGEELWLAGLYWPDQVGLSGHSDGDVVAHAMVDALLGAAGLGDIGQVFGTADAAYANAHGEVFVVEAVRMLRNAGFRVVNVSVQVIGLRPKVGPRRDEAQVVLSGWVKAPVSLSATTTDGLGFTGRGEGVCAIATALIEQV